jgi:hypothetical protein
VRARGEGEAERLLEQLRQAHGNGIIYSATVKAVELTEF